MKTQYVCSKCGYITAKWLGQCPECKEWNSLEEQEIENKKKNSLNINSNKRTIVSGPKIVARGFVPQAIIGDIVENLENVAFDIVKKMINVEKTA